MLLPAAGGHGCSLTCGHVAQVSASQICHMALPSSWIISLYLILIRTLSWDLGPLRKSRIISPQTLNLNYICKDPFPPKVHIHRSQDMDRSFVGGPPFNSLQVSLSTINLCPCNPLSLNILTCEMGTESLTFLSHGFAETHTFPLVNDQGME